MDIQRNKPIITFQPRPSSGRFWLVLMAVILIAIGIAPALSLGLTSSNAVFTLIILVTVASAFLILAFWFPTVRYELDQDQLILRYGPVLTHRIPLDKIQTIRCRNLSLTIWSTLRFSGITLFTVPYADMGNVRMCATSALNNILLIETEKEKHGLTTADVKPFLAAF